MKRIIIIAGAVVVLVVIGLVVFFLLHQAPAAPASTGTTGKLPGVTGQNNPGITGGGSGTSQGTQGSTGSTGTDQGTTPGSGAPAAIKGFGPISNDPVLSYFVDPQNNVSIIKTSGVISKISGGQTVDLSSLQIQGILSGAFSFDGKKAFVNFGDPTNPQTSVFDVATKAWTSLPKGILSPRWSPSDSRVAYLTSSPAAGTITITTLNATSPKNAPLPLMTLHAQDITLQWLNKNFLILADRVTALSGGSTFLFDIPKRTLTPIITEKNGNESIWTGASSSTTPIGLVFMSGPANRGGHLQLVDPGGSPGENLSFLTLPSKCAFSIQTIVASSTPTSSLPAAPTSTTGTVKKKPVVIKVPPPPPSHTFLYCAIPRDQNKLSFSYLPDDYNQMSIFTTDNIIKVDIATGDVAPAFNDQSQTVDASVMHFANNSLFFINRYDQKLYGVIFN